MKSLVTKISTFFLIAMSAISCNGESSPHGVRLYADIVDDETIKLVATNEFSTKISLVNPTYAVTPGEQNGVEIHIADEKGREIPVCAMIDPVKRKGDHIVDLDSGESISQVFDVGTLGRRYCLKTGKYDAHLILRQPNDSYYSNSIVLVVK